MEGVNPGGKVHRPASPSNGLQKVKTYGLGWWSLKRGSCLEGCDAFDRHCGCNGDSRRRRCVMMGTWAVGVDGWG